MSSWGILAVILGICLFEMTAFGKEIVLLSKLPRNLIVQASPSPDSVLEAGIDKLTVRVMINETVSSQILTTYKKIAVKLCYAPISQKDRGWRKSNDNLKKDKACQFDIVSYPFMKDNTVDWIVERNIPLATYYVRAYATDENGKKVAYGQSTNAQKTSNLFTVNAISGKHASIDVAAACFSAFSVASLVGFLVMEKRKMLKSKSQEK